MKSVSLTCKIHMGIIIIDPVIFPLSEWYLYFVAIPAACGSLVLIIAVAAGVYCHRRHKGG